MRGIWHSLHCLMPFAAAPAPVAAPTGGVIWFWISPIYFGFLWNIFTYPLFIYHSLFLSPPPSPLTPVPRDGPRVAATVALLCTLATPFAPSSLPSLWSCPWWLALHPRCHPSPSLSPLTSRSPLTLALTPDHHCSCGRWSRPDCWVDEFGFFSRPSSGGTGRVWRRPDIGRVIFISIPVLNMLVYTCCKTFVCSRSVRSIIDVLLITILR